VTRRTAAEIRSIEVTTQLLQRWPLPLPPQDGDKEERGHVLVIGGAQEMPGAIILAAVAALRAGAGKLTVATGASIAALVAQAIPEARVIGLRETPDGGLRASEAKRLPTQVDAVLIGPGMQDEAATASFTAAVLSRFVDTQVILDAAAMSVVLPDPSAAANGRRTRRAHPAHRAGSADAFRFASSVLLTPHAGEMAHLTGASKESIQADAATVALIMAAKWNAVVALKGATTFIAGPAAKLWRHRSGNAGLAISGSGDTLAGLIAGVAARGASLEQASVWGIALHARAGSALEKRIGPLGFLAREISGEVPQLMRTLAAGR
jgi:hydroxyethylthiazole kinase-like uncharacterized protein yjeF